MPEPARTPAPSEAAAVEAAPFARHRDGHSAADIDAILARADRYHGDGLNPTEVRRLCAEVRHLRTMAFPPDKGHGAP